MASARLDEIAARNRRSLLDIDRRLIDRCPTHACKECTHEATKQNAADYLSPGWQSETSEFAGIAGGTQRGRGARCDNALLELPLCARRQPRKHWTTDGTRSLETDEEEIRMKLRSIAASALIAIAGTA